MEDKRTKQALKNLRDAFEADYAILILSKERFDKVFTSADDTKQEFAEMSEILNSCANLMNIKRGKEMNNEKRGFAEYRALKSKDRAGASVLCLQKKRESLYNDKRQSF